MLHGFSMRVYVTASFLTVLLVYINLYSNRELCNTEIKGAARARCLCLIPLWGSTNTHVINMNYLELTMKTTWTNSILLSSLSYLLKNVRLRLRIVL